MFASWAGSLLHDWFGNQEATRVKTEGDRGAAYRPIADYGLIGDCHTAALVSSQGSIDWFCAPAFDSPSVFGALLDAAHGGHFAVRPASRFESDAAYLPKSAVLVTTFRTAEGSIALTDFMALRRGEGARPFAQPRADRRLIRLIEGVTGEVEVAMELRPRPVYGLRAATFLAHAEGYSFSAGDGTELRLCSSFPAIADQGSVRARVRVRSGERLALVLDLNAASPQGGMEELFGAADALAETLDFWRAWCAGCRYRGRYAEAAMRSMITLKLLSFAPTGAMLAAPTTSLPEQIGGLRNWDYRYTWIRDASFGFYALFEAGHNEDAERFMEWICETAMRCEPGALQIMYGIRGERELTERVLDHLEGYRGSKPVRIGNAASTQFQLDVYGELLDCFHTIRRSGALPEATLRHLWPVFSKQVDVVAARWREPDSGIWEIRSRPRHFVYSKVMAWVALDRGIKAAEEMELPGNVARWRAEREALRREILERGYNPSVGAFTQSYDSEALDAANLMLPIVDFIPAADPRMQSTIEAIRSRLMSNGLVYRYRDTDDGLPGSEATFAICTFWLVDNLTALGRIDEAVDLFESMLARASPLGLFAEELDAASGAHLGNFPQAFSHLGLVNAAINLEQKIDEQSGRSAASQRRDVTGAAIASQQ